MYSILIVAAEILTTGKCPLNCKYCYIPKSKYMNRIHADLIEYLAQGTYVEELKSLGNIKYLGFWGTEPTLTLDLLTNLLPSLIKTFPQLKEISFSTSMMTNTQVILKFAQALKGTKIKLNVQMSLDGPAWITDKNRIKGAATVVPENFFNLVKDLNKSKSCAVEFKWKSTHNIDNMKIFINDPNKVHEYIGYFESLAWEFRRINRRKSIALATNSYIPSLVVPGKYTRNDGKIFLQYLKVLHSMNFETTYTSRLRRLFNHWHHLHNRRQFSCSGGDSNVGVSPGKYHICHRTFYLNDDRYVKSILENGIENWDVSLFRKGTIDLVRDRYIVPVSDLTRFKYVLRGYHDFWRFQLGHIISMLTEMALIGQVNDVYQTSLAVLFALFISTGLSCPTENLLNTGSIHLQPISLIRLFGNGAFEEILRNCNVSTRK